MQNTELPFGFSLPLPDAGSHPSTRPALRARYDARRREVVATAAALFAERGYDGTSMSELTAATGLAAGGLYHYIGARTTSSSRSATSSWSRC